MMSTKPGTRPEILIVDDQDNWRGLLSEILSSVGQVTAVSNFDDAKSLLQDQIFHVLVLDIRLIDGDPRDEQGMLILERLRLEEGDFDTEVVIVTGYATPETATRSLVDLQAANYFQKGDFDYVKFQRVVREAAERALARKSTQSLERHSVLLVEDDSAWGANLADILEKDGYRVQVALDNKDALEHLESGGYRLAVVSLGLGATDGSDVQSMKLLRHISAQQPRVEVIAIAESPSVPLLVDVLKYGNVRRDLFYKHALDVDGFRRAVEETFEVILQRYAVAWIEGHVPGQALRLGQEYGLRVTVQSGRSLKYRSASFFVIPSGETERLRVAIFAEDMDTQPSRVQTLELPPTRPPLPILFHIRPTSPGQKGISVDLHQGAILLVSLDLGVLEVVQ